MHGWKTNGSKLIYKNPWIVLKEYAITYPNGRPGIYGVVEKGPGIAVVALNQKGEIYFTKQYRYTVNQVLLEIPAGAIARGESELASARRELFEETGIKAKRYTRLGSFYTALGHENAEIIAFLAEGLDESKLTHANKEHDEGILEVMAFPLSKVKQLIRHNKIHCGITLASLNLLFTRSA
jgi:ADP-ribose pyrophosphatase